MTLESPCSHLNAFRSVVPNLGLQDDKWERKEVLLFILEDFSLIFEFFVKYFSKEMDAKSQKKFGTTALDVLKTFPFQSNVA